MTDQPVAVIGSIDPNRKDYRPPLENVGLAPDAAEALGHELCEAGYRILVFASAPGFLENHVVRGYAANEKAQRDSIVVRYPRDRDPAIHGDFPEEADVQKAHLFVHDQDTHPRWEVSYYLSVKDMRGMVMMGGGNATLVIGLMGLSGDVPTVTVPYFGGQAAEVWALTDRSRLIDRSMHRAMNQTWTDGSARNLVALLGLQEKKRLRLRQQARQQAGLRSLFAIAAAVVGLGLTAYGTFYGTKSAFWFSICFFGVPVVAGVFGSLCRSLMDYLKGGVFETGESILVTPALGIAAGIVSALTFALAQMATVTGDGDVPARIAAGTSGLDRLVLFMFVIAFAAGLTFDAVFAKLRKTDVLRTDVIDARS